MYYPETLEMEKADRFNLVFFGNVNKPSLNCAYGFFHAYDFPINMHLHNYYEINIITNGSGRHYVESKSIETTKGDVFFIPPNVKHGYYEYEHLEIFNILIHPLFFKFFKQQTDNITGLKYLFDIESKLHSPFTAKINISLSQDKLKGLLPFLSELNELRKKQLNQAYAPAEDHLSIKMNALVLYCLTCICENIQEKNNHNNPILYDFIHSLEYINAHFNENLTILDFANECHLSVSTYTRLFKKNLNITPSQYILNLKLEKSISLLISSLSSIADIAVACGFFDSSHFIAKFKRKYGITPKEYRKKHTSTTDAENQKIL